MRITKIMKKPELHTKHANYENLRFPCENDENHENHIIPYENTANHENHMIPLSNDQNH